MMLRHILFAMVLALTLARPAAADPALYVARAPSVTLYLLGSIHILPPETKWQTPAMEHAIGAADRFWVELILADAKPKAWAERLDASKGKNVTALVTVGASHMGGPGDLRELLATRAFAVELVPPQGATP